MGIPARKKDRYTYQDYLNLQDDKRYELIEGELIMVPSPNVWHQEVSGNLEYYLRQFVKANNLGHVFDAPLDVVLDEENVVQPDILFISQEKAALITKQNIQGAPDLVIEIVSPTSAYYDLVKKKKLYARFGVQEYWIVDPEERTVEIFNLSGGEMVLTSRLTQSEQTVTSLVLAGFKLALSQIFTF